MSPARAAHARREPARRPHAEPFEQDTVLVTQCVAVVPRWNIEHVVNLDLHRRAVLEREAEPTTEHDTHMPGLAPVATNDRAHERRPPPAWVKHHSRDRQVAELHECLTRASVLRDLVRRLQALRGQSLPHRL